MAYGPHASVALLAIHPHFADEILNGRKSVEFRKRAFGRDVDYVVLYATSPIKRVVGFFEVSYTWTERPQTLWSKYAHVGGIGEAEFCEYYRDSDRGVAIGIGRVWALNEPIALAALDESLTAPQSFSYLPADIFTPLGEGETREVRECAEGLVD